MSRVQQCFQKHQLQYLTQIPRDISCSPAYAFNAYARYLKRMSSTLATLGATTCLGQPGHPNRQKFLPCWKKAPFCCWRRFEFSWQRFFNIKFCAKKQPKIGGGVSMSECLLKFVALRRIYSRAAFLLGLSVEISAGICRGLSAESSAGGCRSSQSQALLLQAAESRPCCEELKNGRKARNSPAGGLAKTRFRLFRTPAPPPHLLFEPPHPHLWFPPPPPSNNNSPRVPSRSACASCVCHRSQRTSLARRMELRLRSLPLAKSGEIGGNLPVFLGVDHSKVLSRG